MGSLFSGPDVSNRQTRQALANLQSTQESVGESVRPVGLNAGGLRSTFARGSVNLSSSPERQALISGLAGQFTEQAGLTRGLREQVAPGVSALRAARLQEIENARQAAISNLRENLARRRVLGSSFAQDALARAELEFGQAKEKTAAESFLQELDLTNQLIGQEYNLSRQAFSTQIGELNLQADIATKLTAQATDALTASAQIQSQLAQQQAVTSANLSMAQARLDAEAQAGAGSLFGTLATTPLKGTLLGAGFGMA